MPEEYFEEEPLTNFEKTLDKLKKLHRKKSEDYAGSSNRFRNFDDATYGISQFKNDRDKTFAWPIFTKLSRLGNLLSSGATPNNESIGDSLEDIAVYCLLWKEDIEENRKPIEPGTIIKTNHIFKYYCAQCTNETKDCICKK